MAGSVTFAVGERQVPGYLALPASEKGPGILVLHAWWGLNEFFRTLCERFAQEGFVVFAWRDRRPLARAWEWWAFRWEVSGR